MADTPLPMAPNTCWRRWGEIARKTAPRLNIENVRNIIAIPLSAFARRTAATKALNWYRYQGLTAYWKVESRNLAASEENRSQAEHRKRAQHNSHSIIRFRSADGGNKSVELVPISGINRILESRVQEPGGQ